MSYYTCNLIKTGDRHHVIPKRRRHYEPFKFDGLSFDLVARSKDAQKKVWLQEIPQDQWQKPLTRRFFEKIEVIGEVTGCWHWRGAGGNTLKKKGCGFNSMMFWDSLHKKFVGARQFAYRFFFGEWDKKCCIGNTCWNPLCVSPYHLVARTRSEVMLQQPHHKFRNAKYCVGGHKFTKENTGYGSKGQRVCRACRREKSRFVRSVTLDSGLGTGAWNRKKTHCKNGHPLIGENLCVKNQSGGRPGLARICKICRRETYKRSYYRAKGVIYTTAQLVV